MNPAETESFQRGEDVTFPLLARDAAGAVLDIGGGALSVEIWWRGGCAIVLEEGSGVAILDLHPPTADEGDEQAPHALATLSVAQTSTIPAGRIAKVRSRFVDSLGRVFVAPFDWLDDVAAAAAPGMAIAGRQGPAGPPGLAGLNAAPLVGIETVSAIVGIQAGAVVRIDPDSLGGLAPPPSLLT